MAKQNDLKDDKGDRRNKRGSLLINVSETQKKQQNEIKYI